MVLSLDAAALNREAEAIIASIKAEPLHAAHRVALANVRLLQGQYPKALQQLQVACQADPEWVPQAQLVKMLVQCEATREAVFAGKIQADLLAPAPQWLQWMMQALKTEGQEAAELRQQALDLAPETAGTLNQETAFHWLSDGDERLGPVLEVYTASDYFWLPIEQLAAVELQPQGHALDLLWMKAVLSLGNDKVKKITGYLPMRYPKSDEAFGSSDFETEWTQGLTTDGWQGRGVRVWYLDGKAVPINDVASLAFHTAS